MMGIRIDAESESGNTALSAWLDNNDYIYIYIYINITSPGGNTPQDTNYTATCLLSRKLSKLDELDMQDIAGEAGTSL